MDDTTKDPVKFTGCRPVLRVSDLAASLTYYCGNLGFVKEWVMPADGKPTFAYVYRGDFELFLSQELPVGSPMCIVVGLPSTGAVTALWEEYKMTDALVVETPSRRPWGTFEMRVRDRDGHIFRMLH
jgi:uncharacterized glyoxalase superfamily protein PhnB